MGIQIKWRGEEHLPGKIKLKIKRELGWATMGIKMSLQWKWR